MKTQINKKYKFDLFIRLGNSQEFNVGSKIIEAINYDQANKLLNKLDIPFCHFILVNQIK
jgi:hypothetical protein